MESRREFIMTKEAALAQRKTLSAEASSMCTYIDCCLLYCCTPPVAFEPYARLEVRVITSTRTSYLYYFSFV